MPGEERIAIEKPNGHYCFACGTANPIGLKLDFYRSGEAVCTDVVLERFHEGWENIVHGGIISTLLDEVMSWAIMYKKRTLLVTRNMNIKYVRPVTVGIPLTARGWFVDDSEPPKIRARAEIRDEKERLLVRSRGEFVRLSKEQFSLIPKEIREDMVSVFSNFD